jgi:hypothetical protein
MSMLVKAEPQALEVAGSNPADPIDILYIHIIITARYVGRY